MMKRLIPGVTRRGIFLLIPLALTISSAMAVPPPGGSLDPLAIPKYVTPLVIPPALYDDDGIPMSVSVSLAQFTQQVLPTSGCTAAQALNPAIVCDGDAFPATTLWGYGDPSRPGPVAAGGSFNNPALTMEVTQNTPTTVTWINGLVDASGAYLPHIIKDVNGDPLIDQTLHWAAPNQDCLDLVPRTDCRGASADPYTGPIPMVTHVHGAHVGPVSDGYPEAWWLPDATNIPAGYATEGTFYDTSAAAAPGSAVFSYTNDQPTTTLWFHDHSLGITRLNVYAASAGFWLIRTPADGETGLISGTLPGPGPGLLGDPFAPAQSAIRDIPLAIQPKSFNADGSLFFPAARAFFEGLGTGEVFADNTDVNIPFLPQPTSDIAPVWNPEAFFNTHVVNGNTWPQLEVAPERYRFRVLNAADSRFLNLSLFVVRGNGTLSSIELPIYQIGSEQGLLPKVVQLKTGFATPLSGNGRDVCREGLVRLVQRFPWLEPIVQRICVLPVPGTFAEQALLVGPAERADVIVDFSLLRGGTRVRMINTAPDAPFGGFPDVPADPATTGQVMEFVVNRTLATPGGDPSTPPRSLVLDANPGGAPKLGASTVTRDLALLEEESTLLCVTIDPVTGVIDQVPGSTPPNCEGGGVPFAPKAAVLGINGSLGAAGATVTLWDDPIETNPALNAVETWELWNQTVDSHPIHLHLVKFEVVNRQVIGGAIRPPEPWEAGWKDTVIAYPGEVTRVKTVFDIPGLYVWHCHILSHEDNEMMVPYCVGTAGADCPSELF
jgi:FtsP/CotA-like multicopper oxidase with cupredoxin domain